MNSALAPSTGRPRVTLSNPSTEYSRLAGDGRGAGRGTRILGLGRGSRCDLRGAGARVGGPELVPRAIEQDDAQRQGSPY